MNGHNNNSNNRKSNGSGGGSGMAGKIISDCKHEQILLGRLSP